jgi:flavin reductase (DIM6/NTAB) family NADH-FMN oxidoreductase RutF/DNA-binding IclR family transcriptional regulator
MSEIDPVRYRQVLGHFPTGVAVITGLDAAGSPAGLAVGSFTSVSLQPPLVAFMPDRSSTSWPRIRDSGAFCVNILGAHQESICRLFAVHGGDKFADLAWTPAGSGSPVLDGVLAWADCDVESIHPAGDHDIVVGRVRDLGTGPSALPLVFFQGGYGRFHALSLAAWEGDLVLQMRSADLARAHMEQLAQELHVECVASAVLGEEMVLVARAGTLASEALPTDVGRRIPFVPPLGTAFVAWASPPARQAWLDRLGRAPDPEARVVLEHTLATVRRRGFSIGRDVAWHARAARLLSTEPTAGTEADTAEQMRALIRTLPPDYESPDASADADVRTVSMPVFGPQHSVVLVLSVTVAGRSGLGADLEETVSRLGAASTAVTAALTTPPAAGASPGSDPTGQVAG